MKRQIPVYRFAVRPLRAALAQVGLVPVYVLPRGQLREFAGVYYCLVL